MPDRTRTAKSTTTARVRPAGTAGTAGTAGDDTPAPGSAPDPTTGYLATVPSEDNRVVPHGDIPVKDTAERRTLADEWAAARTEYGGEIERTTISGDTERDAEMVRLTFVFKNGSRVAADGETTAAAWARLVGRIRKVAAITEDEDYTGEGSAS